MDKLITRGNAMRCLAILFGLVAVVAFGAMAAAAFNSAIDCAVFGLFFCAMWTIAYTCFMFAELCDTHDEMAEYWDSRNNG